MIRYEYSVDGFDWTPDLAPRLTNHIRLALQTEWGFSYRYFNSFNYFLRERWRRNVSLSAETASTPTTGE